MQLDKTTIQKLEKLISDAKAKIERNHTEIMKNITVSSKLEVIVSPDAREQVKNLLDSSSAASAQAKEYSELIERIKSASLSLEMNGRDYDSRKQSLNSKITQAESLISQGIAQGVISRDRVDVLESTIAESRSSLKKMEKILTPIETKLSGIPDIPGGLSALQQKPAITEGF
ncbi:MAG: hypothetical protein MPEBLZ_01801 [Candidatus Methanoperedens nitroreducens]|uniref:Uncharacterized protein n=1 Tax=Candidatus Methanoperedens nitratireducens TaxID=1392998 RepID=A0A0N8KR08_9EURY|nr:hypothetical protein [Candidatus Methanoperedens sp. BLZ2]KAB2948451.1 MAG: hypothetical protein F9K14_01080 [Candidatus Methanoperedens sp.]KPQ43618.1 MAG: hypothetical protein MPEBLZ_01801 [Candidatus Methanoperedens sp. BLZ1]MBZ0174455.1 hypothetical protein [Candidatus Methanoperedens nitroreducens]MCX9078475.1 hypothetical protein [Candidatus Methanoperedens sp.]